MTLIAQPDNRSRDAAILLALDSDDMDAGEELWRQHAPVAFSGMLGLQGFTWDDQTQTYHKGRRTVREQDVRAIVYLLILAAQDDLESITRRMLDKEISTDQWRDEMEAEIRAVNAAAVMAASGGKPNVTPDARATATGAAGKGGLADAAVRLDRFKDKLDAGEAGSDAEILARSGLYAATATGTYQAARRLSHQTATDEKGNLLYLMEINVLDLTTDDHCAECPELSDLGWVPIGSIPEPGWRICRGNCRCNIAYSLTGDWNQP